MGYIGNAPIAGAFRKLDTITFDSVTMTFQARVGGTAVILGTAQNVLISISGVLQEPGNSYTVAGSNIIFTEAPLTADSFFGILLGTVGEVTTVTDATVTEAKLAVGAVTETKLATAAVTETKLATAAVTASKIAANSIDLSSNKVFGVVPVLLGGTGATSLKTINNQTITGTGDIATISNSKSFYFGNS